MNAFPTVVPFADALAIVAAVAAQHRIERESVPLARSHGRVLAQEVGDGEVLLRAGQMLTPSRVALAAARGLASLSVARKPTVAVFTCGDELVEPGMPLAPGQIHDSNRELLMGLLRADGLEPTAWPRLPDDPARIAIALRDAGCAFDLIVTSGALSAGGAGHIAAVLAQFGQTHFRQVGTTPGTPLLFGSLDQARLLGLPGDPSAALVGYLVLGRALIDGLQGRSEPRQRWRARLAAPIDVRRSCGDFVRARLRSDEYGCLHAEPDAGAGAPQAWLADVANAFIVVPEGTQQLAAGAVVEVLGDVPGGR